MVPSGRRDGKRIARHQSWVEIGRGGDRKAASLVLKQSGDNREFVIGKENMSKESRQNTRCYLTRYASKENYKHSHRDNGKIAVAQSRLRIRKKQLKKRRQ